MILPGADKIMVEREKIVEYLLNAMHPDNGGKARFFLGLGFDRNEWQPLAAALRKAAESHPVSKSMASPHGMKYIVDARIETPGGKTPMVRTVWIIDLGVDRPRLVTAYPREE
jgi:uncharacterized protein DUF6883